jgi:hypothetical protein
MKAERWNCDSDAIYDYYFNMGYAPQELDNNIVIWIKINEKH